MSRLIKTGIGIAAGIVILLAALVLGRLWLAETAAEIYLSAQGIPDADLNVVGLDHRSVRVRDVRLGESAGAARIDVNYDLFTGRIDRVEAEGLRLSAGWRGGELDLGPLEPLASGGGSGDETGVDLPAIDLTDIAIDLDTAEGAARIELPGRISLPRDGAPSVDTEFSLDHPRLAARGRVETVDADGAATEIRGTMTELRLAGGNGPVPLRAENIGFNARLGPDGYTARLDGALPAIGLDVRASGHAAAPFDGRGLALDARLNLHDAALLGQAVPETGLAGGSARLDIAFSGDLPPEDPAGAAGQMTVRLESDLAGDGRLFETFRGAVDATTDLTGDRAETVFWNAGLAAGGIAPDLRPDAGAALARIAGPDMALSLGEGFRLTLDRPAGFLLGGEPLRVAATGNADLRAEARLRLEFAELAIAPDAWTADRFSLTAAQLFPEAEAPWPGPYDIAIRSARAEAAPCRLDGCAPFEGELHDISGALRPLLGDMKLPVIEIEGLDAVAGPEQRQIAIGLPGRAGLGEDGALLADTRLTFRHPKLAAEGRIAAAGNAGGQRIEAAIETLRIAGEDEPLTPESLSFTLDAGETELKARMAAKVPELGIDGATDLRAPRPFGRKEAALELDLAVADLSALAARLPFLPPELTAGAVNVAYRGATRLVGDNNEGAGPGKLATDGRLDLTLRDLIAGGQTIREASYAGSLSFGATLAMDGRVDLRLPPLDAGGVAIDSLRLQGPVTVAGDTEGTAVELGGGTLRTEGISADGGITVPGPVTAAVNGGTIRLGPCTAAGCAPAPRSAAANLGLDRLTIRTGSDPDPVELQTVRLAVTTPLSGGIGPLTTDIAAQAVRVGDMARLEGVTLKGGVDLAAGRLDQAIAVDRIEADPSLVQAAPPMSATGRLTGAFADPRLAGKLHSISGPEVGAAFDADGNAVRVELDSTHAGTVMSFLQKFGALDARTVTAGGSVSGEIVLPLADRGAPRAAVEFEDVSLATAEATASGISGTVAFSSLQPIRTPDPQTLRIESLDAGVPLTEIDARFDIDAGPDGAVLRFQALEGRMLSGGFSFEPFQVTAPPRDADLRLHLDRVSMAELVGLLGLGGVSMDGELSGVIPVSIDAEERVAIDNARLTGGTNGALRIATEQARGLLGERGGEQVDLMLRALEDFRYDRLEIDLNKRPDGEAQVKVRLEGRNPAVLDGHPFVFNISVEGNADRLAETILTVYRASSGVIQTGVRTLQ